VVIARPYKAPLMKPIYVGKKPRTHKVYKPKAYKPKVYKPKRTKTVVFRH
jgi:hypothetical protein